LYTGFGDDGLDVSHNFFEGDMEYWINEQSRNVSVVREVDGKEQEKEEDEVEDVEDEDDTELWKKVIQEHALELVEPAAAALSHLRSPY
jgi:hypothetical protein